MVFQWGFLWFTQNQITSLQGLSPFPGDISMVKQAFLAPELPRQARQRWDVLVVCIFNLGSCNGH